MTNLLFNTPNSMLFIGLNKRLSNIYLTYMLLLSKTIFGNIYQYIIKTKPTKKNLKKKNKFRYEMNNW